MSALKCSAWHGTGCIFRTLSKWLELSEMYPYLEVMNVRAKKKKKKKKPKHLFYINQSQEGNLVDCRELRLINLSTSKRKSRELLLTLVPRTPISREKKKILISRLFGADTDLTPCQLVKHQRAPALGLH